jgi:leader peptidase (prepilin peptidase)/N-methyltransferase
MGLGVHVPFGPMLAIAGALYFLFLRVQVDAWFDQLTTLL